MFLTKVGSPVNLRFYSSDCTGEREVMSGQSEQALCGSTVFGAHTFFLALFRLLISPVSFF